MYIIKFIISLFELLRHRNILVEAYDNERLVEKLSYAISSQFRRGPFAQLYTVVNPYIKDGQYSPEQVMGLDDNAEDTAQWITGWIFERMSIIRDFITTQNLFDILTFETQDLGDSNYLFIIKPLILVDTQSYLWRALIELVVLITLGVSAYFIFF